jgi:hypothetical protein
MNDLSDLAQPELINDSRVTPRRQSFKAKGIIVKFQLAYIQMDLDKKKFKKIKKKIKKNSYRRISKNSKIKYAEIYYGSTFKAYSFKISAL